MHVRHGSEKQVHRFPGLPKAFATIRPSSRSLSKKTKESYTLGSHALLSEACKIALRVADEVGCRCIITDAYRNRTDWYAKYGFVALEGAAESGPQRMFLDIRTLRLALKDPRK